MNGIIHLKIAATHQGPVEKSDGPEMPGLTDKSWYYADLFIEIENNSFIKLTPFKAELVSSIPKGSMPVLLADKNGKGCIGGKVEDLLYIDDETLLLVFDKKRYLSTSLAPGGTFFVLRSFDDWDHSDLEGNAKSMISNAEVPLSKFKG